MTETMIERAARALMALDYPEEAGGELGEFYMDRHGEAYRAQVRAVLTAMREPSEAMLPNPHETSTSLYAAVRTMEDESVSSEQAFAAIWAAMIDAALAEGV